MRFFPLLLIGAALLLGLPEAAAGPSARSLIAELRSGSEVRVRVRAALDLGKSGDSRNARGPLEEALDDKSAAVRAAAAAGLRTLGDGRSIPALKRHQRDSSPAVRSQIASTLAALQSRKSADAESKKTSVLVKLGRVTATKNIASAALIDQLRATARQKLSALPGVAVMTEGGDASEEGKRLGLPVVLITACIKQSKQTTEGDSLVYSAKVEFVVHTMPDEAIVGLITGSASGRAEAREAGDQERIASLRSEVLAAAIDSALRRAPDALRAAMK
jgi:hypothetical protein